MKIIDKEVKKKKIEKILESELNAALSDDSDEDINLESNYRSNIDEQHQKHEEEEDKRIKEQITRMTVSIFLFIDYSCWKLLSKMKENQKSLLEQNIRIHSAYFHMTRTITIFI